MLLRARVQQKLAWLAAAIDDTILAGSAAACTAPRRSLASFSPPGQACFLVPYMTLAQSGRCEKNELPAVGILDKGLHSIITPETARAALQTRQNEA